MNVATALLARALAPLLPAPLGHVVKQAVKQWRRGYEAAGFAGRWTPSANMPAPVTETHGASPLTGSRAAFQIVNNPYMAAVNNAFKTDMCGPDGPSLQHDDPAIVAAWNERFFPNCDAERIRTLAHLMEGGLTSWLCYGEALYIMKIDEDGALRLQLISPAQIDGTRDEDLGEAGWIIAGIHVARDGRRLAYYVMPTPPDHPFASANAADAVRIDSSDVIHMFDPTFPGQVRGISPLSAVLTRALEVDQGEDAGLMLQKVAALLSVFLSDPSGSVDLGAVTKAGGKLPEVSLEPGAVRILPEGVIPTTVEPPKTEDLVGFLKHMVRSIAAGVGLPAWMVSHDLSDVNFSSARLGALTWRRRAQSLQRNLLVGQFLNRVFYRWLALEVIAGRLNVDLDNVAPPVWLFQGWPSIDPLKECEADVLAISAGIKSRAEVISNAGRDPETVRAEIARDPTPPPPAPAQPSPRSTQNA